MIIKVTSATGKEIRIPLPGAMLFSPMVIQLVLKSNRSASQIPPQTADRICAVLQSWKEAHGSWELIHAESAGGDTVIIEI